VPREGALVVEADHRDDVVHVLVALDRARGEAGPAGEDRVIVDAALVEELVPDRLGEPTVEDAVAMEVAEPRRPRRDASSPRVPGPALTPGQESTSRVMRLLAVSLVVLISASYKLKLG
jgi:hypothetical protein